MASIGDYIAEEQAAGEMPTDTIMAVSEAKNLVFGEMVWETKDRRNGQPRSRPSLKQRLADNVSARFYPSDTWNGKPVVIKDSVHKPVFFKSNVTGGDVGWPRADKVDYALAEGNVYLLLPVGTRNVGSITLKAAETADAHNPAEPF